MERDTGAHPGWEHRFRLACAHMPGVGWRSPICRPRDSVAACRTGRGPPATDQETPVLSLALTFSSPASSPSSPASSIPRRRCRPPSPAAGTQSEPEAKAEPTSTRPQPQATGSAGRRRACSSSRRLDAATDQLLASLQGWRPITTPCTETAPHSRRRRATAFSWRPVVQMSS